MKRIIAAALIGLTLTACTPPEPMYFGVPASQWKTLSPAEKKQVIKGYNQREKINAQNAPAENFISATKAVIKQKQAQKYREKHPFAPPPMPGD